MAQRADRQDVLLLSSDVKATQRINIDTVMNRMSNLALVLLIFAVLAVAYLPTTRLIVNAWMYQFGYSHGVLIFLVAIWLIWTESRNQTSAPSMPPAWLFVLAALAGIVWLFAFISATQAIHMVTFVVLTYCAVSGVLGSTPASRFLVPVGILVFSIPIWGMVTPTLQQLTINANSLLLSWFGWTAYITGDVVHVRAGAFRITEGCAGTHFFVVALTLGVIHAHLNFNTRTRQAIIVAAFAVTGLIANWLRVFIIVIVGDITDMQHFLITGDHYQFGWAIFVCALVPLFILGHYMQKTEGEREMEPDAAKGGSHPKVNRRYRNAAESIPTLRSVFLALLILTPPLWAAVVEKRNFVASELELSLPAAIGAWNRAGASQSLMELSPSFEGEQAETFRMYTRDDRSVWLYVNRYLRQRQGAELVGYYNTWYPDEWFARAESVMKLETGPATVQLVVEQIERNGKTKIIIHGYIINERWIATETEAKVRGAIQSILGKPISGAVAIIVDCASDCDMAMITALEFLGDARPVITRVINAGLVSSIGQNHYSTGD